MKMTKIMAAVMSVVMLLACTAFSASAANNVNLTTITPGFNNTTVYEATADGLGVTLGGPWTTTEGFGYTYWNLPWDTFVNTPYLVVDIVDDDIANFGGWCDITYGWIGTIYQTVKVADKQVIDLRTLVNEGEVNMCICFTFTDDVAFDALYLTDDPNATTGGGNNDTGVESAVAVAAAAVIGAASLMVISRKK